MSAAVAPAQPTTLPPSVERVSPRQFAAIAHPTAAASTSPSTNEPAAKRARSNGSPESPLRAEGLNSNVKSSPSSLRNGAPPIVKVKKEPGSPALTSSRPRPKRLDLSSSMSHSRGPQTARPSAPLTSRESAGLHLQDMSIACLSPGFATHDPAMREQLQRSMDVREQQRQIIEARQKGTKPGSSHEQQDGPRTTQDTTLFGVQTGSRTPTTSRRKGPPPGLSIAAPAAAQFARDRVIQSAPLHQTFTGLRPGEFSQSRHAQHGPSGLSQTSHIHHVPANQTNNRLPPIADVFANDTLEGPRCGNNNSPGHSSHSNAAPRVPSPGFAPAQQPRSQHPPLSARVREFRSAEEAMQSLSGGRDELLPKVVQYGGVQPPTPPSPMPDPRHQHSVSGRHLLSHPDQESRPEIIARTQSMNGRRRGREEYERDNGSPPSIYNRSEPKRATFAVCGEQGEEEDWKTNMSSADKRAEFLRLCERAWDLFHS